MLFKSAVLTQASGSVGGITASHNRGGMYFRARTIPVNPGSPQQVTVRNAMSALVNAWGDVLTAAQRNAWGVYASQVPLINKLGDSTFVSGIAMFVRSNVARIQAGLAQVNDGPTIYTLGVVEDTSMTVSEATQQAEVTVGTQGQWDDEDGAAALIYISRPQGPGINFFNGPYRLAGKIDGDSSTPPSFPFTIDLPFPVQEGQRVFFRQRVTRAGGRLSGSFRGFSTVSA